MAARIEVGAGGFAVHGDLDFRSVPSLQRQTEERFRIADNETAGDITVDLAAVGQSDSAGVALLIDWLRLATKTGRQLRLRNVPGQMRAIIRVSSLEELLPLGIEKP